jgi:hypothetical protein
MTSPQAIIIGAAMIAVSIIIVNGFQPAKAAMNGPFMLMHHSNTVANAGVFRIDTATGDVSYCYVGGDGNLVCSGGVK